MSLQIWQYIYKFQSVGLDRSWVGKLTNLVFNLIFQTNRGNQQNKPDSINHIQTSNYRTFQKLTTQITPNIPKTVPALLVKRGCWYTKYCATSIFCSSGQIHQKAIMVHCRNISPVLLPLQGPTYMEVLTYR